MKGTDMGSGEGACQHTFSGEKREKCKMAVEDGNAFVDTMVRFDVNHSEEVSYDGDPGQPPHEVSLRDADPTDSTPYGYYFQWVTPDGMYYTQEQ